MHAPRPPLALALVLAGLAGPPALATAAQTHTQAGTVAGAAAQAQSGAQAGSQLRGVITFDKNWANPQRSRLVWRVWRLHDGRRTLVEQDAWRAGSGFTATSTNACRKNDGWLPDGGYQPRLHANYWGSLIKGRAISLGQKQCADGTMRTDLFIHTEQGDRNAQCADQPGDQVCRWEYPKINDYRSFGCIKLSPRDLRELYDAWTRHFDLGADSRVHVRVVR
jgi:hypothetical protein